MYYSHLDRHNQTTTDFHLSPHKIGHDDELTVARAKGMDHPIYKGYENTKEKGTEVLTAMYGIHMFGDFSICLALKLE